MNEYSWVGDRSFQKRVVSTSHRTSAIPGALGDVDFLTTTMVWVLTWRLSGAAQVVSAALAANLGVTIPDVLPELMVGLPVAWLILRRASTGSILLPAWCPMLVFSLIVLIREYFVAEAGGVFIWRYGYGLIVLYAGYVGFVNYGLSSQQWSRIRSSFMAAAVVMTAIVVLAWTTPLRLNTIGQESSASALSIAIATQQVSTSGSIHLNGLSFALGTAVILLLSMRRARSKKLNLIDLLFLGGVTFVVIGLASRGGFLLLVSAFVYHAVKRLGRGRNRIPTIGLGIVAIVLAFIAFLEIQSVIAERVYVLQRLSSEPGSGGPFLGRWQQVIATWASFISSPVFGHGYASAGVSGLHHVIKSNFHATQVLASYGVVGIIPWGILLVQIFLRPIKWDRLMIVVLAISAYNWAITFPLAIVGYWIYRDRVNGELRDSQYDVHQIRMLR